jgi:pyruvate/2-oxoglutarate dehydrogenase complex dihydrolipoamide acyltransferase (E2) component
LARVYHLAMVYKLVLPKMGEVEELRVLQWHKNEGEAIDSGQLLVELETDKAVIEVRSARASFLRSIVVDKGAWALVGPPLAWFSDAADEAVSTDGAQDFAPEFEIL